MELNKKLEKITEQFNQDAAFVKHIKRESVEARKQEYADVSQEIELKRRNSIRKSPSPDNNSPKGRFSKSPANRMNSYASMQSKDMPSSTISLAHQKSSGIKNKHKRSNSSLGKKERKLVSPYPCESAYESKKKIILKHSQDRQSQKVGRYTEHIRVGNFNKGQDPTSDYLNENSITIDAE